MRIVKAGARFFTTGAGAAFDSPESITLESGVGLTSAGMVAHTPRKRALTSSIMVFARCFDLIVVPRNDAVIISDFMDLVISSCKKF